MTDILTLREAMRAASAKLDAENAALQILETELHEVPPQLQAAIRLRITAQLKVISAGRAVFNAAVAAYQAAVAADPMHAADPGLPLLLLPVRIETAYFPNAAEQQDLVVRIYPDDIHVDSHEPELTEEELAAGTEYWRAAWGAGSNRTRLDAAWAVILSRLKPARAAWAVRALTPAVPRPPEVPIDQPQPDPPLADVGSRPGTFNRPAHTTLLPDFWRIAGFRTDGSELFYAEGLPIPETLDLSFAPPAAIPPDAPDDLPFHPEGRWLVDLDDAIAAGMAVRIPLTGPDFSVGQLFVLGVNAAIAPDEGAARIESALLAHQYTNGLAFLPVGSPTNNTAQTRSAWQSAPSVPVPADADAARAAYLRGSNQNAAVAAAALGIDGNEALAVSPNALLDQQSDIATIQQFLWPAIAGKSLSWLYTTWDFPVGAVQQTWIEKIDFPFVQALQNHVGRWVRSRGTLPTMRIGNQPYGVLPALSLDDWVTPVDDPLAKVVTLLRTMRSYWFASVSATPHVPVTPDPVNADSTVVNILQRLPVSNDIQVRTEADPVYQAVSSLPPAPIPGMATNSEYYLASPSASTSPLPIRVVNDTAADLRVLTNYQQLFHDGVAVLEQQPGHTRDTFGTKYKDLIGQQTFPDPPPADLFLSLIQDSYVDPLIQDPVNNVNSLAGFIICGALFFDPANPQFIQQVNKTLPAALAFVASYDTLCSTNPAIWESAIHETLDVFSHRLDAWITSLAARRLDEMRAAKPSGVVLGAFGFVENLAPRSAVSDQHYIHAPSMNHAATAAVLRAGYESHLNTGPLAVNLTSSRVRNADWLAAGIRSGQTLGALLGYRIERGLHEASLDRLIAPLRKKFPLPQVIAPNPDDSQVTGPVLDGLALSKANNPLANDPNLVLAGNETSAWNALLNDLSTVLDSFGDLLVAESVHHLVLGNPLRAGLTADTAGGSEPLPDHFDVTSTPRSAKPLMWQLGAILPADFRSSATGWRTDRPRAITEPHADAWAAGVLGNAEAWSISCTLTTADGPIARAITLADLGLCALDVVAESSGNPSQLELRIGEFVSAGLPDGATVAVSHDSNADGTPGFGELVSLTDRIRSVFGKASPLGPEHLQGPGTSTTAGIDLNELDTRVGLLEGSLAASTVALQTAAQALDSAAGADDATLLAAVQALRAALTNVADHGVPAAWPAAGAGSAASNVSALSAQSASLIAALFPLANTPRPSLPDASADGTAIIAWLRQITAYVQGIVGAAIPLLPVYVLPAGSVYSTAFGAQPAGADNPAVMTWLRRIARIRDKAGAMHDVLLAAESFESTPAAFTVAQFPGAPDAPWAGLPFPQAKPPDARVSFVFSTPAPVDPSVPFCGFLCDSWTEQLPGVTSVATGDRKYEASEVTGMAFKVDTPSATAPQTLLLAVAPDPAVGWSFDVLLDTVRETLDLARIRAVDLGELIRFGRVLPAIHSSSNLDQALLDAAKQMAVHP